MSVPAAPTLLAPAFRPHAPQIAGRAVVVAHPGQGRGAMLALATGVGKTATGLWIAVEEHLARGDRVLWIAHRVELTSRQPLDALARWWPQWRAQAGVVQAERSGSDARIVFASIATLARRERLEELLSHGPFGLVVVDEAHRSTSPTYRAVLDRIVGTAGDTPGAPRLLGLSATPSAPGISDRWDLVYSYGIAEALADGLLRRPYVARYQIPDFDAASVATRGLDYDAPELERALLAAHVVDHTVTALRQEYEATALPYRDDRRTLSARGRSCLVFTSGVRQAEETSDALRADGWRSRWVCGDTPAGDRRRILDGFAAGKIDVICNASVLTEGTDLPRASVAVLARPTRSRTLYVQIAGRVLRRHEEADEALVIDMAGATELHSLVGAPVLISGGGCPQTGGEHRYMADGVGGACECGHRIACLATGGPHRWKRGVCAKCGSHQCREGVEVGIPEHTWVPSGPALRRCVQCGIEHRDPIASIVGARVEVDAGLWRRLWRREAADAWACHLGRPGVAICQETPGGWLPWYVRPGLRSTDPPTATRLSDGPVEPRHARLILLDLIRQAQAIEDKRHPVEGWQGRGGARREAAQAVHWLVRGGDRGAR